VPSEAQHTETEDAAFNASRADYLSYDPLYIAKYADPKLVNIEGIDMSRFVDIVCGAKGIATYNNRRQTEFDVSENNYIAGLSYEMPVYNIDDDSDYYVCIPSVNMFNSNFREYDIMVAYNNDYAEMITGYHYEKGILYVPKTAVDHPVNTRPVPDGTTIAVQLNYAIGGDMDLSKSIPVQVLSDTEPVNKTIHVSNIFDRDLVNIDTGVRGRKTDDITVYLNGHMIPINEDRWAYSRQTGELEILEYPGVISSINIVFASRTLISKAGDALVSAVDEGLAGINDAGANYDEIVFAPKFPVTHYTELRYLTGYEVTKAMVDVRYILTDEGMRYDVYSPAKKITAHVLLPKDKNCSGLWIDGYNTEYKIATIENSNYVDFELTDIKSSKVSIQIDFAN
jgi:hypothetical protein